MAEQLPESQWQSTCTASSASRCQGLQVSCHIQKKPSESWPKSCDVTRTLLSFFVVGSRVHFNSMKDSDFVQQMVKAASVAFGGGRTNDYPKA